MSIQTVGINLSALGDITPPVIEINFTISQMMIDLPRNATQITNGWFPYLVLGAIFFITFWYLADKNPLSDFKFTDIRAMTLAFTISASVGLIQIMIGFISSWKVVVMFVLASLLSNIILIIIENKQ